MPGPRDGPLDDQPPRCSSERERVLLRRMCDRAGVEFTEWECARLLTEFKRNLTQRQWVWLRQNTKIETPEDALRSLILIGFENRRLKRMRLRGRGRDRVWAEPRQQSRMKTLVAGEARATQGTVSIAARRARARAHAQARSRRADQARGASRRGRPPYKRRR